MPSCQYTLNGTVKATNESSIIEDISNVDDEETINLILNSDVSLAQTVYQTSSEDVVTDLTNDTLNTTDDA